MVINGEAGIVGSGASRQGGSVSEDHHVAILMCTWNGERHLGAQLESIAKQTHANWTLWVSDDGSTDGTAGILRNFMARNPTRNVFPVNGPRQGFAENYMSLVRRAEIKTDFVAFCDQDDVWLPHHLEVSVRALQQRSHRAPALHCARTQYIDEQGMPIGESRRLPSSCSFPGALAQNFCSGNTMVLNAGAHDLLRQAPLADVSAHDWLACLLVSGAGGAVTCGADVHVQYRQHARNSMGENRSLRAKWLRVKQLQTGTLRRWTDQNIRILSLYERILTPQNRDVLRRFVAARSGSPWSRLVNLRASGVRRADRVSDLAYKVALLCGLV